MNVKKIRALAAALFNEAPYISNITNPVEHEKALALVEDIFVNNHDDGVYDEREILVSALCSAIKRYEGSAPEFAVFNARIAELDN
jgi:HTH-type transcriptional regulator/antitoxin HigA